MRRCKGEGRRSVPSPDQFIRTLKQDGWSIIRGGKHWKARSKDGIIIPVPCSSSDVRAMKNALCQKKRVDEGRSYSRRRP